MVFTSSKIYNFIFHFSSLLIGLLGAVYFESRAFVIGFGIAFTVTFFIYTKTTYSKKIYLLAATMMVLSLIISICFVKTDSSLGRIFIYKISTKIYKNNWLTGIGIGNFKNTYMYYQAAYFKDGKFTEKEFLLADNTYFAFNDYYQFVIETGLAGIFFLSTAFIGLFIIIKKALAQTRPFILLNAIGILIGVCSAAFFTYVFNKIEFQIVASICMMIILFYFFKTTNAGFLRRSGTTTMIVVIILLSWCFISKIRNYIAVGKLKEAKDLERAGYRTEAMNRLVSLKEDLGNDPEYLELSSFLLTNAMLLPEAQKATIKLIKIKPSNDFYTRLGYIYALSNKPKKAEEAYLLAIAMVPNRFTNRYKLFKLYKELGAKEKAKSCGQTILAIPVKVPSFFVTQIKESVKKDIN
jgi:tetratricopeptide (TPR) repeat protein